MIPSESLEESVDVFLRDVYDDGKSAATTLIINQVATGAFHATNASEKRERIPLDDEEKKKRKKIADKKHREKLKAYHKEIEEKMKAREQKLKAAEEKAKVLESANKSLNEESKTLKVQVGQLKYEIERKNETIVVQQQQIAVLCRNQDENRKIEEEVRGLKTEICKLEHMNRSLVAERDTMTNQLRIATTSIEQLQSTVYILNATMTYQQQFVDLYTNGLNHFQELPMEQEQLWQEENQVLGFVGDGGLNATSISEIQPMMDSEMSQQVEKLKREVEEARNDRAEIKKQMDEIRAETKMKMDEVLVEMRAMKAIMSGYMKSGNV